MKYQEDQNQINQVDNDENNEINIHYALINEKNKFKIILATPDWGKVLSNFFSFEKLYKIEGSIEGAFITNNLPFGKEKKIISCIYIV
ncbi:unnamed protein product [Rhizophagus irregularis]|nr:unnamed protein product [Rhizophagus irregularis]